MFAFSGGRAAGSGCPPWEGLQCPHNQPHLHGPHGLRAQLGHTILEPSMRRSGPRPEGRGPLEAVSRGVARCPGQRQQGAGRLRLGPRTSWALPPLPAPVATSWALPAVAEHQEGSGEPQGALGSTAAPERRASCTPSSPVPQAQPHPPRPPEKHAVCSANRALASTSWGALGSPFPHPAWGPGTSCW